MDHVLADLRYAARQLRRAPAFTLVTVATLALGIGANSALFSIVDGVLLRPLPFPDPERLVFIWSSEKAHGVPESTVSYPDFADWQRQARSYSAMAAYMSGTSSVSAGVEPAQVDTLVVTTGFFDVLGVRPELGRAFSADESDWGKHRVAVLSHGLWQRLYAGDRGVVGRALLVNRQPFTVIGVMPAAASALAPDAALWMPLAAPPGLPVERNDRFLQVIARLAPGVDAEAARAEMDTIAGRLSQAYRENEGVTAYLVPMHAQLTGRVRRALLVLLGAAGVMVLVACVNLANLLLARASAREREMAVRRSLGATAGRLLGQLLTETVLLAVLGGAAGLLLAYWGVDGARVLIGPRLPRLEQVSVDARVLAFTLALSLATGIAFGLAPALQLARLPLREAMAGGGRGGGERAGARRLRDLLVVAQTALALVLAAGAGLLLTSLHRLGAAPTGFDPDDVVSLQVSLPEAQYREEAQRVAFYSELLGRVRGLPGVRAAGATLTMPLGAGNRYWMALEVEGRPAPTYRAAIPIVAYFQVTPGYLEAMGIPLVAGRRIAESDASISAKVAVVDQELARRHFPGQDPLGQRIRTGTGPDEPWLTIVGVVGDVKLDRLDEERPPAVYTAHAQGAHGITGTMVVAVRPATTSAGLAAAVRDQVRALDRQLPVAEVATVRELLGRALVPARLNAVLLGAFAALGVVLAAIGIHGVLSFAVAQRRHEVGVRMALGATAADIVRLVVGEGLRLTLAGIGLGVLGALAAARVMASMLYEVEPTDPATLAATAMLLGVVALCAISMPARRAARVDPVVALRYE